MIYFAWDAKMSKAHGNAWPHVLGGWVQQILNDIDGGVPNAFSMFVRGATSARYWHCAYQGLVDVVSSAFACEMARFHVVRSGETA